MDNTLQNTSLRNNVSSSWWTSKKKFLFIAFFILVVLILALVLVSQKTKAATATKNFQGVTAPAGTTSAKAVWGKATALPAPMTGTEATTDNYAAISAQDGVNWSAGSGKGSSFSPYKQFRFYLTETNITQLTAGAVGFGQYAYGFDAMYNYQLHIWNFSSNQWEKLGEHINSTATALSGSKTANLANYKDASNYVYLATFNGYAAYDENYNSLLSDDYVYLTVTYTAGSANLSQKHFRIFSDDAALGSATPLSNEDTSYTNAPTNTNLRIRLQTANTGQASANVVRRLEFKEGEDAWTQITATTNNVRLSLSDKFADAAATSAKLTSSGTFVAGQGKESSSDTIAFALAASQYTEDEYSISFRPEAAGKAYQFRLTNAGIAYNSYEKTPAIAVSTELSLSETTTATKNFVNATSPASASAPKATAGKDTNLPTPMAGAEGSQDNYNSIAVEDNTTWLNSSSKDVEDRAYKQFRFSVTEPNLVALEGKAKGFGSMPYPVAMFSYQLSIWNFSNKTWELLGQNGASTPAWASGKKTTNIANYKDTNNYVYLATQGPSGDGESYPGFLADDYIELVVYYTSPNIGQKNFRFFKDDAGLNAATPASVEGITYYNVLADSTVRLRIQTANTGTSSADVTRRLEFSQDGGDWTQISTNTANVHLTGAQFSDGEATTSRLSAIGTFTPGQGKKLNSDTSKISLEKSKYIEDEFSLKFDPSSAGHSFRFRLTNAGQELDKYSKLPLVAVDCTGAIDRTFCDVPTDYWAFWQIEAINREKINEGCRIDVSGTKYYCPYYWMSRELAAQMIVRARKETPTACTGVFADVGADNQYCGDIEKAYADGIFSASSTNPLKFNPTGAITRGQVAEILVKATGTTAYNNPTPKFSDVPASDPLYSYVEAAYKSGFQSGCGSDASGKLKFCPTNTITKAYFSAVLVSAFKIPLFIGRIQGYVKDNDGNFVEGAKVEIQNTDESWTEKATTDSTGYYFIDRLDPGKEYVLRAQKSSPMYVYQNEAKVTTLSGNVTTWADDLVLQKSGKLKGKVYLETQDQPLAGVQIKTQINEQEYLGQANENGDYEFLLPEGQALVWAGYRQYDSSETQEATITFNQTMTLDFNLSQDFPAAMAGSVYDCFGNLVKDAAIVVDDEYFGYIDEGGNYYIPGLPGGYLYSVEIVRDDGYYYPSEYENGLVDFDYGLQNLDFHCLTKYE